MKDTYVLHSDSYGFLDGYDLTMNQMTVCEDEEDATVFTKEEALIRSDVLNGMFKIRLVNKK